MELIDLCISMGFCIVNGRCGDDEGVGDFTLHTHNGSSLVDYFIVSEDLLYYVNNFHVTGPSVFSDHVSLNCSFTGYTTDNPQVYATSETSLVKGKKRIKWEHILWHM